MTIALRTDNGTLSNELHYRKTALQAPMIGLLNRQYTKKWDKKSNINNYFDVFGGRMTKMFPWGNAAGLLS